MKLREAFEKWMFGNEAEDGESVIAWQAFQAGAALFTTPNWEALPEWAQYATIDFDGYRKLHTVEPSCHIGMWSSPGSRLGTTMHCPVAEDCLFIRPKKIWWRDISETKRVAVWDNTLKRMAILGRPLSDDEMKNDRYRPLTDEEIDSLKRGCQTI